MPQISPRSAAETSIHGPDDRRLGDRDEPDLERDELDRERVELDRERDELDLDLDRLLRLLLELDLLGVRLIVLRFAIAQMFSLVALLYHVLLMYTRADPEQAGLLKSRCRPVIGRRAS
jgi:hypothetical protein